MDGESQKKMETKKNQVESQGLKKYLKWKHLLDGLKIRLDLAEEMVSELEARLIEITREKRKKIGGESEQSLSDDGQYQAIKHV